MKRQALGIVLCTLLLTTFGNEFLARTQIAHSLKQQHLRLLSQSHESDNSSNPDSCGDIIIAVNSTTAIAGVINKTANVAHAIDVENGITGLFNSTCGTVILINLDQKTGFYLTGSISSKLWNKSQSLEAFILGLKCLKEFQELGEKSGQKFSYENVSAEITLRIRVAFLALSSGRLFASGKGALEVVVKLSSSLVGILRTTLKGILTVFGSGSFATTRDCHAITAIVQGLASLVARLKGGISVLIKNNIKISLKAIMSAPSGTDALLYILAQLSKRVDLKEVLCNALDDMALSWGIIDRLAGNQTQGLNGLISVAGKTFGAIKGYVSISDLTWTLLYFVGSAPKEGLKEEVKTTNKRHICKIEKRNLTNVLSKFYATRKDIQDDKWCANGVNISAIIFELLKDLPCPLEAAVKLLISLDKVVPPKDTVSTLLVATVELLTTPERLDILHTLIPNLKLDCEDPQKIAADILKKLNFKAIKKEKDSITCLERIPILGEIFKAVAAALRKSGKDTDLATILGSDIKCLVEKIVDILKNASKGDTGGDINGDPSGGGAGNADGTTSGSTGRNAPVGNAHEEVSKNRNLRNGFKARAHEHNLEENSKHHAGHSVRKHAKENQEDRHSQDKYRSQAKSNNF